MPPPAHTRVAAAGRIGPRDRDVEGGPGTLEIVRGLGPNLPQPAPFCTANRSVGYDLTTRIRMYSFASPAGIFFVEGAHDPFNEFAPSDVDDGASPPTRFRVRPLGGPERTEIVVGLGGEAAGEAARCPLAGQVIAGVCGLALGVLGVRVLLKR